MQTPKILIVDNEDSFTYNLVQLFEHAGAQIQIISGRTTAEASLEGYNGIVFSPGPGVPSEFPFMFNILENDNSAPVLGICLGMQAIALHFGGTLYRQLQVQHGQIHQLHLIKGASDLFYNIPDELEVGLYHSWAVEFQSLPDSLSITCLSGQKIIMGLRHKTRKIEGLQFHPESFLTPSGNLIIANWLNTLS